MIDPRHALGLEGEEAAARHLEATGMRVIERRWRCRAGEIDLVAEDGEVLVFVEVKARGGDGFGTPAEAVTAGKRRRLATLATWYLVERDAQDRPCRFDVVEVVAHGSGAEIRHLPDAFRPGWDDRGRRRSC
ncbi:MAG TPA: YraN family protein [Candidatus Polarisedimenticolaceae bacterium]